MKTKKKTIKTRVQVNLKHGKNGYISYEGEDTAPDFYDFLTIENFDIIEYSPNALIIELNGERLVIMKMASMESGKVIWRWYVI
jgi:hypothetical protein